MRDLRQHKRFATSFLITWEAVSGGKAGDGIAENMGIGGCKISTQTPLTVGAEPALTLFLPRHGLLHLQGVVRWQVGCDMGLEFIRLEPSQLERLHEFIKTLEEKAAVNRTSDPRL